MPAGRVFPNTNPRNGLALPGKESDGRGKCVLMSRVADLGKKSRNCQGGLEGSAPAGHLDPMGILNPLIQQKIHSRSNAWSDPGAASRCWESPKKEGEVPQSVFGSAELLVLTKGSLRARAVPGNAGTAAPSRAGTRLFIPAGMGTRCDTSTVPCSSTYPTPSPAR